MRTSFRIVAAACLGLLVFAAATLMAQRGNAPAATSSRAAADATARIAASAEAVLKTLSETERAKVQFPYGPQRSKWSNLAGYARNGLRWGDLTPAQQTAVMSVLETAFSKEGYEKIVGIMHAEEIFSHVRPPSTRGVQFGENEYRFALVGTPSPTAPWQLQFGGHHLAVNLTLAGSQAVLTPTLTGVQPAKYEVGGRTVRPLGKEYDIAFSLINSLDDAQRKQAILNYAITDLVLGAGMDGQTIQPEGLKVSAMSASQQAMLMDLARQWVGIMKDEYAEPRLAEIRSNLAQSYFAWSGPTTHGSPVYFRIHGPTVVIEFAPQENTTDHVHAMYRDPTNEYGAKFTNR